VCLTERERQRFRGPRNHDKMYVIGHQTPSEDAEVMAAGVSAKYLDVADTVLIGEEDVLPIIASLRDVMRYAREDESGSA
jgi:hypothetical protein